MLAVAITAYGCNSDSPVQTQDRVDPSIGDEEAIPSVHVVDTVTLRPNGDATPSSNWCVTDPPSIFCSGGDPRWSAVDEPCEDVLTDDAFIESTNYGQYHQFTFQDLPGSVPANATITQIVFKLCGITHDIPTSGPEITQSLYLSYFIDEEEQACDEFSCPHWDCVRNAGCDSVAWNERDENHWELPFEDLEFSVSDLASLEMGLESGGALNPSNGFMQVWQLEAEVTYEYDLLITSSEIYAFVPCATAYVRFTVNQSGTTGKVRYGSSNCSSSYVNTTVVGSTHYASFDVSGFGTKFYWQPEVTLGSDTHAGSCAEKKKVSPGLEGCPPPGWWPF